MSKKSTIARVAAAGAVAIGLATVTMTPAAHATDNSPCGAKFHHAGTTVQYCKLWRGNVPVLNSSWGKVGTLVDGGSANWFECQAKGGEYTYQGDKNDWWAYTEADNGKWGWVSEVFFSGGNNNERDAGLRLC
jgi:hypothetical protein